MKSTTDIDLDVSDRKSALKCIPHIPAMMLSRGYPEQHNTGVYLQNIPVLRSGLAAIEYKKAEEMGYFKLDFLNNTIYGGIKDKQHLMDLTSEPMWELLLNQEFSEQLAHVHGHFSVIEFIKPKSIIDLAVVLALIRPGKRHLVGKDRTDIDATVWEPPSDGSYYFKKAHAVAFSLSIVVQMNLIVEGLMNG